MTSLVEKVRLLTASGLFDEDWYVSRYQDVLRSRMSPAEHYVRVGQYIGRQPSLTDDGAGAVRFLAACRVASPEQLHKDAALRAAIDAFGLFDEGWYRARYMPGVSPDVDALEDYLAQSAGNPLVDPGPLFSTIHYAQENPDLGGMAPLVHASKYGFHEGRAIFDPHKVDAFLTEARDKECLAVGDLLDRSRTVHLVCWENGNFFFHEIAQYLQITLQAGGFDVTLGNDLPQSVSADDDIIVVAPHEFCVHGSGKAWDQHLLARAIYLNTEQWHTSWFSLAYRFIMLSRTAIDMNPASAAGLQSLGVRTAFLPILPREGTPFHVANAPISRNFAEARYIHELTYAPDLAGRPYDVLFVGAANGRREAALASLAPVLADHEAFVHCPRIDGPLRAGDPDMMSTTNLVQIARNAKILLSIHQGASRYFEWHRLFLFGIMEGCVVLSEPCIPNAFVQAGTHYLECKLGDMGERLQWLLETSEGRAEMIRIRLNCQRLRQDGLEWKISAA